MKNVSKDSYIFLTQKLSSVMTGAKLGRMTNMKKIVTAKPLSPHTPQCRQQMVYGGEEGSEQKRV